MVETRKIRQRGKLEEYQGNVNKVFMKQPQHFWFWHSNIKKLHSQEKAALS